MKYKPNFPKILRDYAREHEFFGAAISEIARVFGIDRGTVYDWMGRYPEFGRAVNELREQIDDNVENALLKCALGYSFEEKKIIRDGTGKDSQVLQAQVVQRFKPADTNAAKFWLMNRRVSSWREKQEVESTNKTVIVLADSPEDYV